MSLADREPQMEHRRHYICRQLGETQYWESATLTEDFFVTIACLFFGPDFWWNLKTHPSFDDSGSFCTWDEHFVCRVLPEEILPRILLVGSNPSVKAQSNEAFTSDTASGRLLHSWIKGIKAKFLFENVISEKTENNRPLSKKERQEAAQTLYDRIDSIGPTRIVALGKVAAEVLEMSGYEGEFLEMPHPSGRNRKLNDKKYLAKKLDNLRDFCETGYLEWDDL